MSILCLSIASSVIGRNITIKYTKGRHVYSVSVASPVNHDAIMLEAKKHWDILNKVEFKLCKDKVAINKGTHYSQNVDFTIKVDCKGFSNFTADEAYEYAKCSTDINDQYFIKIDSNSQSDHFCIT